MTVCQKKCIYIQCLLSIDILCNYFLIYDTLVRMFQAAFYPNDKVEEGSKDLAMRNLACEGGSKGKGQL